MPPHHSCCAVFAPLPFFSGIHLVPPIASKNITHSMPNILAVCKIVWTNVVVCFCLFQPMKSQQAGRHFPFVVCTRVSHVVAGCNMNLSDTTSPEATPQKQWRILWGKPVKLKFWFITITITREILRGLPKKIEANVPLGKTGQMSTLVASWMMLRGKSGGLSKVVYRQMKKVLHLQ